MKIIEALKITKDLLKKADDLKDKIHKHASDLDCETPVYPDQKEQLARWIQAYGDILKECLQLNYRIAKTNLVTKVTIELDGKQVEKSIFEWILRRRKLSEMEMTMWRGVGDKGLREGAINQSNGTTMNVKIRRYFDPKERDHKLSELSSEPSRIDAKLEIVNCVTDLVD